MVIYGRTKLGYFKQIKSDILIKPSKKLAELFGIMLGDGSLYVVKNKHYQTRIAGDKRNDFEYLTQYVASLCFKLFKTKFYLKYCKSNELLICSGKRNVAETLIKYKFLPGNKMVNNLGVPKWILNNGAYTKYCLRGLIDTDGSVYPRNKTHRFPDIWFKSAIPKLSNDFVMMLDKLGIEHTKWSNCGTPQVAINKRKDVLKYFSEVGFSNPKHIKRFKKFLN